MARTDVLILCGGRGKRLDHRTQHIPKALIPAGGKPMLQSIMDQFIRQGFAHFILGTGYLSQSIENFVAGTYSDFDTEISDAGESAGMLKRICHARSSIRSEDVIVAYGDTFIEINYSEMLAFHQSKGGMITLVTGAVQNPFGIVDMDPHHQIHSFREKPTFNYYIGSLVFKKSLLDKVTQEDENAEDGQGLVRLFEKVAGQGQLYGFPHRGLQITFNTENELQNAQNVLSRYYTQREK